MLQLASMVLGGVWTSIDHVLDSVLAMRARFAVLLALGNEGSSIGIEAREGCVTLSGAVISSTVAERAVSAVRAIAPIGVTDRLHVASVKPRRYADHEIQRAVHVQLGGIRALRVSGIRVAAVYDGLVLLTGSAVSTALHLSVIEAVAAVPGVRRVTTEVTIGTTTDDVGAVAA